MKEGSVKKLDGYANIAFIVITLLLGVLLIKQYVFSNAAKTASATHTHNISVGAKVFIPEVDWSTSKQTLILAVKPSCVYCNLSAPFYQKLSKEKDGLGLRLIAVLPDTTFDGQKYVDELGVSVNEIKNVAFKSIGITMTPSLILVDEAGVVQGIWRGKLTPDRESEVLDRIKGNTQATSDDKSVQDIEAPVETIDAENLIRLLEKEKGNVLLLDVRDREDYALSHISGARNIPADELAMRAGRELSEAKIIVTYCGCEGTNQIAAKVLTYMDFHKVFTLEGDKNTWEKAGLVMTAEN